MDILQVAHEFSSLLTRLEVKHFIGGSLASSAWAEPRQTNDIDFVLLRHSIQLIKFDNQDFDPYHMPLESVAEAYYSREDFPSFSVLQMDAGIQLDCFIGRSAFDDDTYNNSKEIETGFGPIRIASVDYIFVQKLRWFRLSNHVSQVQWRDLLALLHFHPELSDSRVVKYWVGEFGLQTELKLIQDDQPS